MEDTIYSTFDMGLQEEQNVGEPQSEKSSGWNRYRLEAICSEISLMRDIAQLEFSDSDISRYWYSYILAIF